MPFIPGEDAASCLRDLGLCPGLPGLLRHPDLGGCLVVCRPRAGSAPSPSLRPRASCSWPAAPCPQVSSLQAKPSSPRWPHSCPGPSPWCDPSRACSGSLLGLSVLLSELHHDLLSYL